MRTRLLASLILTTVVISVLIGPGCSTHENATKDHNVKHDAMRKRSEPNSSNTMSQEQRDQLLENRVVVLDSPIDEDIAKDIITRLLYLDDRDPTKPILLFVDSPGGSLANGLAIFDTLDHISPPVHTYCYGRADAMAAVIVAHGEKGNRFASPGAGFSLSDPWSDESDTLPPDEIAEELARSKTAISHALSGDTGKSTKDIEEAMANNARFDATEAKAYNLIDGLRDRNPLDVISK